MKVRDLFVQSVRAYFGYDVDVLTRQQLLQFCKDTGCTYPNWFAVKKYRAPGTVGYGGGYSISVMQQDMVRGKRSPIGDTSNPPVPTPDHNVVSSGDWENTAVPVPTEIGNVIDTALNVPPPPIVPAPVMEEVYTTDLRIPKVDDTFVPFGYAGKLTTILKSRQFFPVFISGMSGNGKTFITEQICAKLKRELITVSITIETNENDLLGGFGLVNGETVWNDGPVVEAMERGAVLLLDEVDLASHKIMCLQSVLNGDGVYLKKCKRKVLPAEGFTVVAAANTKGKGKTQGTYVGTNILNDAFLERFIALFEQDYPSYGLERKILNANLNQLNDTYTPDEVVENKAFVNILVEWASQIRRTFKTGDITEVISTRRLVHIIKYYALFGDKLDAVVEGTNRFSDASKESFTDLYLGLDTDPSTVPADINGTTNINV